jgi:hypothetical protein
MADPTPVLTSPTATGDSTYRPLTGWAIASAICTAVFVVILVGSIIAGIVSRTPPLDLGSSVLLLPLAGGILALIGWWQVQRSEGTLAGAKLVSVSGWTCVLVGLGYVAMIAATEMAVRNQAAEFTDKWVENLIDGDVLMAFWKTIEPERRKDIDPRNALQMGRFKFARPGEKGQLPSFEGNELTRTLGQWGKEVKSHPMGLKEWKYQGGGYQVKQAYRFETPEGSIDAVITVRGSESSRNEFQGRQWFVVVPETGVQKRSPSPLAQRLETLHRQARSFLNDWVAKLNRRQIAEAYLDTLDHEDRRKRMAAYRDGSLTACLTTALTARPGIPALVNFAPLSNEAVSLALFMPGYVDMTQNVLIDADVQGVDPVRTNTKQAIRNWLTPHPISQSTAEVRIGVTGHGLWKVDQDSRVHITPEGALSVTSLAGQILRTAGEVSAELITDPKALNEAEGTHWRILKLHLKRATEPVRPGPPGG